MPSPLIFIMKLHLQNRFDNREYDLSLNAMSVASNPAIFQVAIIMPSTAAFGEYNYSLFLNEDDTVPYETGLLKYRPDTRTVPVEYQRDITYKAYEG